MEAVRRAETLSGRPIRLLEDASLPVIATLSMARDGATEHVLRYRPRVGPIDYFVLYQIGFLNRLFRCPAADRMDLMPTGTAAEQVATLVTAGLAPGAEDTRHAYSFSATVAQWALVTLRSHPTGMRIDQWIHDEFPELRELQARGMADMQQMNTGALTHRMGTLRVPSTLLALNSVYALYADRLLDQERFAIPYEAAGALEDGTRLLALWDQGNSSPQGDQSMIDRWAECLGMRPWYRWIPHRQ